MRRRAGRRGPGVGQHRRVGPGGHRGDTRPALGVDRQAAGDARPPVGGRPGTRPGCDLVDQVAWCSPRGAGTAWGSWESPAAPNLRGDWESITVACRGDWERRPPAGVEGWRDGVGGWPGLVLDGLEPRGPPHRDGHPAPFPVELARRCHPPVDLAGRDRARPVRRVGHDPARRPPARPPGHRHRAPRSATANWPSSGSSQSGLDFRGRRLTKRASDVHRGGLASKPSAPVLSNPSNGDERAQPYDPNTAPRPRPRAGPAMSGCAAASRTALRGEVICDECGTAFDGDRCPTCAQRRRHRAGLEMVGGDLRRDRRWVTVERADDDDGGGWWPTDVRPYDRRGPGRRRAGGLAVVSIRSPPPRAPGRPCRPACRHGRRSRRPPPSPSVLVVRALLGVWAAAGLVAMAAVAGLIAGLGRPRGPGLRPPAARRPTSTVDAGPRAWAPAITWRSPGR